MEENNKIHVEIVSADGGIIPCVVDAEIAVRLQNDPEYKSSFIQALQAHPETSKVDSQSNNMESSQSVVSQSSETRTETKWTGKEAELLVSLRIENDLKFETMKTHKSLWDDISIKMKEKGYFYTAAQLSNKWKSIKREYKSTVDQNLKSGNSRKTCKFFDQLNNIYGTKPSTKPAYVLDSDSSAGTSSHLEESITDVNSDEEERTGEPPHKKQKQNTAGPGRKIRKKASSTSTGVDQLIGWMNNYQEKQQAMQQEHQDFLKKESAEKLKRMDKLLEILSKK